MLLGAHTVRRGIDYAESFPYSASKKKTNYRQICLGVRLWLWSNIHLLWRENIWCNNSIILFIFIHPLTQKTIIHTMERKTKCWDKKRNNVVKKEKLEWVSDTWRPFFYYSIVMKHISMHVCAYICIDSNFYTIGINLQKKIWHTCQTLNSINHYFQGGKVYMYSSIL